jgi:DNA primase
LQNDEFKSALEAVKLRAPIEDVVRERVPGLKKSGALWKACCPFHEERTPSFTVDPRRGTWHCFGACSTGGDQISFIQRFDNLEFWDALEILAARTGVTLPKRGGRIERDDEAQDRTYALLDHALRFYRGQMRTSEGQAAVRYLRERGLTEATAEAFGIGYAPAQGTAFCDEARAQRLDLALCETTSLVRRNAEGRAYDFFRGRLMIPIRDAKGRTVGFGARRLSDEDQAGPKYVNSADSELFKKGTLIYALDRALPFVRKSAHIVLVEGYTDVMAAHQCGVANVVAVLGTATTDDHAALVRRAGARRVSLVFDGDEARRKAAYKALHGLLPLELEIDVVSLSGGIDPCDLFVREGATAFLAELEHARGWFDFLAAGLAGKRGVELAQEVDRVLELLARIGKPVHRDSRIRDLAQHLELPAAGVFEQYSQIERRQRGQRAAPARSAPAQNATAVAPVKPAPAAPRDAEIARAFEQLIVAELHDAALCSVVATEIRHCDDAELVAIHAALLDVLESADPLEPIQPGALFTSLGDHPARERLGRLVSSVRNERDEEFDVRGLFQGALHRLKDRLLVHEEAELTRRMIALDRRQLENPTDPDLALELQEISEASARIRERKRDLVTLSPVRPQSRQVNRHG